jgi:hypothetical protein
MESIMQKLFITVAVSLLAISCSNSGDQWRAKHLYDEFTETKSCIVEENKDYNFKVSPLFGGIYTYNFYAERRGDGEIRAGVKTKPSLPINGDIQLKVGSKLITLTREDTPLDLAPNYPTLQGDTQLAKSMQQLTSSISKIGSPYRAFAGKEAKDLLKAIVGYKGIVKMRSVGINTQTSTTGSFIVDDSFTKALQQCGINL